MPYILPARRKALDPVINQVIAQLDLQTFWNVDGDVNYVFTRILKAVYPPESYFYLNRALGVLEAAKLEFNRIVVAPYEDQKRHDNGDVIGPAEEE